MSEPIMKVTWRCGSCSQIHEDEGPLRDVMKAVEEGFRNGHIVEVGIIDRVEHTMRSLDAADMPFHYTYQDFKGSKS